MTASEGSTLRERAPSPPCAPNGYPAVAHKREGSYARHSFAEEDAGSEEAAGRALAAALERLLREGESNDGAGADKDKSPGIDDDDQDLDSKGADDGPGGVDEVIEQHVGALGRGQLCHALIASLAMVPQGAIFLAMVFFTASPIKAGLAVCDPASPAAAACTAAAASADPARFCAALGPATAPSAAYRWLNPTFSIISEYDFACKDQFNGQLFNSLSLLGLLLGLLAVGRAADRFGRRATLFASVWVAAAATAVAPLVPSFAGVVALRVVACCACAGLALGSYLLVTEAVGPSRRGLASMLTQGFFILGTCLLAGMAAALTDWHTLSYALGGLTAAVLPTYVLLPESARWLLTRPGRKAEATAVLRWLQLRNRGSRNAGWLAPGLWCGSSTSRALILPWKGDGGPVLAPDGPAVGAAAFRSMEGDGGNPQGGVRAFMAGCRRRLFTFPDISQLGWGSSEGKGPVSVGRWEEVEKGRWPAGPPEPGVEGGCGGSATRQAEREGRVQGAGVESTRSAGRRKAAVAADGEEVARPETAILVGPAGEAQEAEGPGEEDGEGEGGDLFGGDAEQQQGVAVRRGRRQGAMLGGIFRLLSAPSSSSSSSSGSGGSEPGSPMSPHVVGTALASPRLWWSPRAGQQLVRRSPHSFPHPGPPVPAPMLARLMSSTVSSPRHLQPAASSPPTSPDAVASRGLPAAPGKARTPHRRTLTAGSPLTPRAPESRPGDRAAAAYGSSSGGGGSAARVTERSPGSSFLRAFPALPLVSPFATVGTPPQLSSPASVSRPRRDGGPAAAAATAASPHTPAATTPPGPSSGRLMHPMSAGGGSLKFSPRVPSLPGGALPGRALSATLSGTVANLPRRNTFFAVPPLAGGALSPVRRAAPHAVQRSHTLGSPPDRRGVRQRTRQSLPQGHGAPSPPAAPGFVQGPVPAGRLSLDMRSAVASPAARVAPLAAVTSAPLPRVPGPQLSSAAYGGPGAGGAREQPVQLPAPTSALWGNNVITHEPNRSAMGSFAHESTYPPPLQQQDRGPTQRQPLLPRPTSPPSHLPVPQPSHSHPPGRPHSPTTDTAAATAHTDQLPEDLAESAEGDAPAAGPTGPALAQHTPVATTTTTTSHVAAPQQQLTLLFMLRHSRVALLFFLVVCLGTLANCLTYYTLSFAADALSLSLYLNFLLLSAIEGPSYLAAAALVDRAGRRPTVAFSMVSAGLCCVLWAAAPPASAARLGLALVGKLGVAAAWAVLFMYAAELFPTPVRSFTSGVVAAVGRVGGAVSPFLLGAGGLAATFVAMGVANMAAGLLVLLLPETMGQAQPDTLEDLHVLAARKAGGKEGSGRGRVGRLVGSLLRMWQRVGWRLGAAGGGWGWLRRRVVRSGAE